MKEPRRQVKIYNFNVYSFHHHRRCWPISIRYLPVNRAAVSLRYTRCRHTHPIPVHCVTAHCWFNSDKLSTTLAQHYSNTGSAVYLAAAHPANTCHLPATVSMLAQRIRRWPVIETALSDCPLFAWTAMRVTLCSSRCQKSHHPDNTIHWPNAYVMLDHRLLRRANIILTLSL